MGRYSRVLMRFRALACFPSRMGKQLLCLPTKKIVRTFFVRTYFVRAYALILSDRRPELSMAKPATPNMAHRAEGVTSWVKSAAR